MAKQKTKVQRQNEQYILLAIVSAVGVLGLVRSLSHISGSVYVLVGLGATALMVGLVVGLSMRRKRNRLRIHDRITAMTHQQVDAMTGIEFEEFLEQLLKLRGYRVETTKVSRDGGADLIAVRGKERISIQAKRYAKTVGNKAVQEAVAAMRMYKCNASMVITSNYYSIDAQRLAAANGTQLVDRDGLGEWMLELIESGKRIK